MMQLSAEFSALEAEKLEISDKILEQVEFDFSKLTMANQELMERLRGVLQQLDVSKSLKHSLQLRTRKETKTLIEKANRLKVDNFFYLNMLRYLKNKMKEA